jgi:branched-chain amino acid transport system permease protein
MKKIQREYLINFAAAVIIFVILYVLQLTGVIGRYYQSILLTLLINIVLTVSLNLATGFLGQLTLGHAGFVSVGAYTAALISLRSGLPEAVAFPIALICGGIVAAIFGIMIGVPALRLKGDYLAIITLGFGEIIRVFILNVKFTGGASGLNGIPIMTNFPYAYTIAVLTITVMFLLIRSRHGRAIISIREDEIAAESSGINTTYYKLLAFTIAAFFAGIAGGLQSHMLFGIDAHTHHPAGIAPWAGPISHADLCHLADCPDAVQTVRTARPPRIVPESSRSVCFAPARQETGPTG